MSRDMGHDLGRDARLAREAIRVYRRYQEEVVERFTLCPWAASARREGRVSERVVLSHAGDPSDALPAIRELSEDREVEIGLVLFPRLKTRPADFERFVSEVSRRDAARHPVGSAPFAMAAFHPEAPADTDDPERLIPFLRRSPDPTIQLIRCESLDRVREGFHEGTAFVDVEALTARLATRLVTSEDTVPLRIRITRANRKTVLKVGVAEVERCLAEIRADRDEAYALIDATAGRE